MSFEDCEPIKRLREARHLGETRIKQYAAEVYATFDKNERLLVRFGMFPAEKMEDAHETLLIEFVDDPQFDKQDLSRLLAVGIMDAANAGKDKLVV